MQTTKIMWLLVLLGGFFDAIAVVLPTLTILAGVLAVLADRPSPSWWVVLLLALFALLSGLRSRMFRDMWAHMREINMQLTKELHKDHQSN